MILICSSRENAVRGFVFKHVLFEDETGMTIASMRSKFQIVNGEEVHRNTILLVNHKEVMNTEVLQTRDEIERVISLY